MDEEMELQERPGIFGKFVGMFVRERDEEIEDLPTDRTDHRMNHSVQPLARYRVTIRRQIVAFEDAYEAAQGLRRGEQQILNLSGTDAALREKIKDFMSGVQYAQDAIWEEIGDNIYLVAPGFAHVEVAPASPRMTAMRN